MYIYSVKLKVVQFDRVEDVFKCILFSVFMANCLKYAKVLLTCITKGAVNNSSLGYIHVISYLHSHAVYIQ